MTDPDYSPKGTAITSINTVFSGITWLKFSPAEYYEAKNRVTERLIEIVEKMVAPDIKKHIEVPLEVLFCRVF